MPGIVPRLHEAAEVRMCPFEHLQLGLGHEQQHDSIAPVSLVMPAGKQAGNAAVPRGTGLLGRPA